MSKCVRIVIPGQPVSKLRPRVTRNGHAYTPEKTVRYEKLVQDMWKVYGSESFGDSPIRMEIDLYMKIPKSESKKKKEQMINGLIKHTKKPDIDNVAKSIIDSLNGKVYDDDSQIVKLMVRKQYSDNPRADVYIMGVDK
jgi:Holliday junction resolvase RusA-like endonuclease